MSGEAPAPPRKSYARELTAAVGLPILVGSLGWGPPLLFGTILSAALLLATAEFVMMTGRDRLVVRLAPPILAGAGLLGMVAVGDHCLLPGLPVLLAACAILFPLAWMWSRAPLEGAMAAITAQWAGLLYVTGLGAASLRLFLDVPGGRRWFGVLLLATWVGDSVAYYVGRKFGRHRFAPLVSPKKSWEGSIGGGLATVLATVLAVRGFFGEGNLLLLTGLGVVLAVLGQMGDLAESLFKRAAGVKDSGGLLPGHGGFLDRIDSLLWTGPVILAVAMAWGR